MINLMRHGGAWYLNDFDPIFEFPADGYLNSFYSGNVDGGRLQEMLSNIEEYRVNVRPERVFTLDQIPEAHACLPVCRDWLFLQIVNIL